MIDEVLELFMDLDASDEQLDCPFIYASARDGYAMYNLDDEKKDMTPLFETIVNYIPAPTGDPDANTIRTNLRKSASANCMSSMV